MTMTTKVLEANGVAFYADIDGQVVMTLCDKGTPLALVRMNPDTARGVAATLAEAAVALALTLDEKARKAKDAAGEAP